MDLFISIHPPRVGWDGGGMGGFNYEIPISIHPPRVGWDNLLWRLGRYHSKFQSTHPVWGGTTFCS